MLNPKLFILLTFLYLTSSKLYQIIAMTASGARYHLNDLYDGKQTKNQWGQITSVGLKQQESLGKIIKKEYSQKIPFLNSIFIKDQVELISKKSNRTIQSGLAQFYGLYPLGNGQKLTNAAPKYHLPPFSNKTDLTEPIFSLPNGQLVFPVKFDGSFIENCLNQQAQIEKNIKFQLVDYNQMVITYTPFLKKMATLFKIDQSQINFTKIAQLYDTINVDRYLNRPLPQQLTKQDLTNMEHLYHWYSFFTRSFNLSKAYNSHPFSKIIQIFDTRSKNINNYSLKYSSVNLQESDLVALQNDLNITSAKCIEQLYRTGSTKALNCEPSTIFSTSLLFELHSDDASTFYVKVRNNGKYIKVCESSSNSCSYTDWKSRLQKYIINPLDICGKIQEKKQPMILIE